MIAETGNVWAEQEAVERWWEAAMRSPNWQERIDSWKAEREDQTRYEERIKKKLTLGCNGWSRWSVEQGPNGVTGAYAESLHPPGLPEHLSDRKSKRKRHKDVKIPELWHGWQV